MINLITDGRYGDATLEIAELIRLADNTAEALSSNMPKSFAYSEVEKSVRAYLERLELAGINFGSQVTRISYVKADSSLNARFGYGVDDDTAWGHSWSPYRTALLKIRRNLFEVAKTETSCRCRLVPPLWPYPGRPNVFTEARIARDSGRPFSIPWLILRELEEYYTDGLLWALCSFGSDKNPFRSLLEVGSHGLAPMGIQYESFWIAVPESALDESQSFRFEELPDRPS